MNDPWRTDASTSASERLEQVDLDGDLGGSEPRPSYSREVAVPKGTDGQLEQGHMQGASPDQVDAKGKGKIEDATPASSQQTPKEQASPATVNGHTPSAAESAHHQTPTQSEQKIPQGTTTQDALPKSMPTVFPNKQPTQKKIDKSLKKSKAAPRVLDSVISKTRQKSVHPPGWCWTSLTKVRPNRDLPPKPKEEDDKHLKQYEHILEESAKAERKRETLAQQRRSTKDKEINAALPIWEKDIVPNWKVVLDDEKLRKIWWSGTMPAKCRGLLWTACIGNGLAIGKCTLAPSLRLSASDISLRALMPASYTKSLAQANSHIEQQRMPQSILDDIDADIQDALPQVKFFQPGAPLHDDLRNLLLAYSVFWKREPSYVCLSTFIPHASSIENLMLFGRVEASPTSPPSSSSTFQCRMPLFLWFVSYKNHVSDISSRKISKIT